MAAFDDAIDGDSVMSAFCTQSCPGHSQQLRSSKLISIRVLEDQWDDLAFHPMQGFVIDELSS